MAHIILSEKELKKFQALNLPNKTSIVLCDDKTNKALKSYLIENKKWALKEDFIEMGRPFEPQEELNLKSTLTK